MLRNAEKPGGRRALFLLSEKGRKIGFIPHGRGPGSRLLMTVVYRAGRAAAYCFLTVVARGGAAVKARILRRIGPVPAVARGGQGGASFQSFYSCHIPAIALRRAAEAVLARGAGSN